jgi:hypothetical protein
MTYNVNEKIAELEMKMYELTNEATTLEQEYNQLKTMEKCAGREGRHLHPRPRVESQVQGLWRGVVVPIW